MLSCCVGCYVVASEVRGSSAAVCEVMHGEV